MQDSGGKPPNSQSQLVHYIQDRGQKILALGEIENVDAIFISERDHQPYLLVYGKLAQQQKTAGLVVCEQKGVNGMRWIGYSHGGIEEVDDLQFTELEFRAGPPKSK